MTACRSNRLNESLEGKAQPRRPACSLNHPVYRLYICGVFHLKPHLVHDEKTEIRWHSIIRSEAQHPSPANAISSLCLCSWDSLMSYLCGDYILYSVYIQFCMFLLFHFPHVHVLFIIYSNSFRASLSSFSTLSSHFCER